MEAIILGKIKITLMFLSLKETIIYLECKKRSCCLALHKIYRKRRCEMDGINKGVLGGIHN